MSLKLFEMLSTLRGVSSLNRAWAIPSRLKHVCSGSGSEGGGDDPASKGEEGLPEELKKIGEEENPNFYKMVEYNAYK